MIVVWRITQRCNLACSFCAYDSRLKGARLNADPAAVLHLGEEIGRFRRDTGERVLVSWLGGEPLLWPMVFDVSCALQQRWDLRFSATTNGTTLHRGDVRAQVLQAFSELTVSVDGLAPFHEDVRGWPGGWPRLRDGVRALARERADRASLRLRANVVLMHDNLAMFEPLCEELADWGVDEITFNGLGGRDRPEFHSEHYLRPADVIRLSTLLPDLRGRLARRGVSLCGGERYLGRLRASAEGRAVPVADCAPGERFLFIDEQCRVAPCSFTSDEFGIKREDVQDVGALPAQFRVRRLTRRATTCGDCPSTHVHAKFGS